MARLITTYEEWLYCSKCGRITLIEEIDPEVMLCPDCLEAQDDM